MRWPCGQNSLAMHSPCAPKYLLPGSPCSPYAGVTHLRPFAHALVMPQFPVLTNSGPQVDAVESDLRCTFDASVSHLRLHADVLAMRWELTRCREFMPSLCRRRSLNAELAAVSDLGLHRERINTGPQVTSADRPGAWTCGLGRLRSA